jgi:hypothetical protein
MTKISSVAFFSLSTIAIAVHLLFSSFGAEAREWNQLPSVRRSGIADDSVKPLPKLQRSGGVDDGIKPLPKLQRSGTEDDSLRPLSPFKREIGTPKDPADRQPARSGADDSI